MVEFSLKFFTVKILCSRQKIGVDSLLDNQIPLCNEYEFCHLDRFSLTIDLIVKGK